MIKKAFWLVAFGCVTGIAACGGGGGGSGGGANASGGNTQSTGSGNSSFNICTAACTTDTDCCYGLTQAQGCGTYPLNGKCENGGCGLPQCTSDSDCQALTPGASCDPILGGLNECVNECQSDSDCSNGQTCSLTTDNGKKVCGGGSSSTGCKTDADCNGSGKCTSQTIAGQSTNVCSCSKDSDCTKQGATKCIPF